MGHIRLDGRADLACGSVRHEHLCCHDHRRLQPPPHDWNRARTNFGPGGLERVRTALLNFLAASLDRPELAATVVVFDAKSPPWGVSPVTYHRGITVHYASGYEDADELIQELIRRHSAPKKLTVVSSDRAVQQAATRRKARAVGSEAWYEELLSRPQQRHDHGRDCRIPPSPSPRSPRNKSSDG